MKKLERFSCFFFDTSVHSDTSFFFFFFFLKLSMASQSSSNHLTVSAYLFQRLRQMGIDTVFGVAGDFALSLFDEIINNKIEYVPCCNEVSEA